MPSDQEVDAFISEANTTYKTSVLLRGDAVKKAKDMPRLPTGIIQVDEAAGGGFPFGKVTLLAGNYSTGKTQLALRAAQQAHLFDHKTKRRITKAKPGEGAYPLYIDAENALDYDWAESCGLDLDRAVISATETSEQCIDLVTKALYADLFSVIIIDSLAAITPSKELEISAEDSTMGVQARLLNGAMRKWVAALNRIKQDGGVGPAIILLNLFRTKLGVMFGDNRTLPGGQGQEGAASLIGYMLSASYDKKNAKGEEMSCVTLKGNFQKNKTYIPRQNFAFNLYLKDSDDHKKGDIDNIPHLIKRGLELNLIRKEGSKVVFGNDTFSTPKELKEQLAKSKSLELKLYRSVLKAGLGVTV